MSDRILGCKSCDLVEQLWEIWKAVVASSDVLIHLLDSVSGLSMASEMLRKGVYFSFI